RVARALASVFTYRSLSVPLLILVENRVQYIAALESADQGDFQPFVSFVFERTLDSIQLFKESLQAAEAPEIESPLAELQALYFTKGGFTHEQVDNAGSIMVQNFTNALQQQGEKLKSHSDKLQIQVGSIGANYPPSRDTSRLPMSGGKQVYASFSTTAPAQAGLVMNFALEVPKNCDVEDEFIIRSMETNQTFEARINELLPVVSPALLMRMTIAAEGIMTKAIPRLVDQAIAAMKNKNL
ncbi:MAG: hypothetical protein M3362_26535, partial [Acidobacteriota bacterium]|nr:hypothetical protein [Acidobacteriota bacterium]